MILTEQQQKAYIHGIIDGWFERWEKEMPNQFREAVADLHNNFRKCDFLNEDQLLWIGCVIRSVYLTYRNYRTSILMNPDQCKKTLKVLLFGPVEMVGSFENLDE
jgi:hypothetical protein